MTGKITYLNIEDFTEQAIFTKSSSECTINNLFFRKSDTFPSHKIKEVLDICNKYNSLHTHTLIVNNQENLTIWIEEKSKIASVQAVESQRNQEVEIELQSNYQSVPTKKITKRYRGQVYEEIVVDWEKMQQMNQQKKPRRKYRGQYID